MPTLEASASNEMLQILEVGLGHNVIGDLELKRSKQRIKRIWIIFNWILKSKVILGIQAFNWPKDDKL